MASWYCVNCEFVTKTEPAEPCPRCNGAIWERAKGKPQGGMKGND